MSAFKGEFGITTQSMLEMFDRCDTFIFARFACFSRTFCLPIATGLVAYLTLASVVPQAYGDEWTNLRGTTTVEATLIGVWNGRALFRLEGGKQVAVKLEDLNAESRIRAQDLQKVLEENLKTRINELDAIATEAAAPAPAQSPQLETPPDYQPPKDGMNLDASLRHAQAQAKAGHIRVYFDSLPASQQAQAEALAKDLLKKVNGSQFELCRETLHQLSKIVVSRQRWLFSHPVFESTTEDDREQWVKMAMTIELLAAPEVTSIESLESKPLAQTIAAVDKAISPLIHTLLSENSLLASTIFPDYSVETQADGRSVAKVDLPIVGTVQTIPMVSLEGRWAEGATAEDAKAKWDKYAADLKATPDGSIRMSDAAEAAVSELSGLLMKLSNASSKAEFHRAMDESLPELTSKVNAWAGVKSTNNPYGEYADPSQAEMERSRMEEEAMRRQQQPETAP